MPEIFVNYRTGDGEHFAALIEQDLSRRFGKDKVFRASKSIRPGENYRKVLSAASAGARALVVIVGPNWLNTRDHVGNKALESKEDWTRKEILNARRHSAHVIPILCGRTVPPLSASELPGVLEWLADNQYLRFDTGNTEADRDKIAAHLVDLVPGLVDSTAKSSPESGGVHNSNTGPIYGVSLQMRDFQQSGGSVGGTVINGSTGPVNSGGGPQYNGPAFHGGVNNYIAGKNTGGIHQSIDTTDDRDADR